MKITAAIAHDRPDLKEYVGRELTVIAWLWARTVASPNPATRGAQIPLVKSFWLSKRRDKQAWIWPVVDKKTHNIGYEIACGSDGPTVTGTVNRKGAKCLLTGDPVSFDFIRSEGKARRLGFALIGIAAEGNRERVYLPPIVEHERVTADAKPSWVPENEMAYNPFSLRPPLYGLNRFSDLFSRRQLTILSLLTDLVDDVRGRVWRDERSIHGSDALSDGAREAYASAIALYLSLAVDKLADLGNAGCLWELVAQCPRNLFGRQALPMHWSFAEGNPFSGSSGSFGVVIENLYRNLVSVLSHPMPCAAGEAKQEDVTALRPRSPAPIVCTDPPYYNNVDYADLADFFYPTFRTSPSDYLRISERWSSQ